jgi:hypothetical protein
MLEVLPRAVATLFAVERVREGVAELIGSVVNELIDEGTFRVSGLHVYLARFRFPLRSSPVKPWLGRSLGAGGAWNACRKQWSTHTRRR